MSLDAVPAAPEPQRTPAPAPDADVTAPESRAPLGNAATASAGPLPGGASAGMGNAAAVRALTTSPGPPDGSCRYPLPDRTLFEQMEQTWPLFGESIDIPLWKGRAGLGWLGWIDFEVSAGASAEASLWTSLGPGELRDICLDDDPSEACVTGSAVLRIPGALAPDLRLEGGLHGAADYLGSIPLAALSGTLAAAGHGTADADLTAAVTITYEDGKVSLETETELTLAVVLAFALDASLTADLFGEQVYAGRWNLVDWRWARDWDIVGRVSLSLRGDRPTGPRFEFRAGEPALDELLRALFDGLLDVEELMAGIRGSVAAAAVPMLDPTAAVLARAAIEAGDYALALDLVVRALPLDSSLFTISYVDLGDEGEGLTTTDYLPGNIPSGPSTVRIYTPAFTSVPWLVSSVMHEYRHVVQHQQGAEPGEMETKTTRAAASRAREVEAYLWEIEHAEDTGLIAQHDNLRDEGERLMWQFEKLGALDPTRQETYRTRVDAALTKVDDIAGVQAPEAPFENTFHHGTDYDTAEKLGTADIGAIGGNDFGRGFYTHSRENWALAREWALRVSRNKRGWGVVTFPVPDEVWEDEIVDVMIFENPDHQPDNIPINPDTGRRFRDWREFVAYNKRFRRDRLPEWPELQVIIGPLWGRYQNDPRVRQVVFTSTGVPVLNRPESKKHRIVHVRLFRAHGAGDAQQ